jgi:hypothetical protein
MLAALHRPSRQTTCTLKQPTTLALTTWRAQAGGFVQTSIIVKEQPDDA